MSIAGFDSLKASLNILVPSLPSVNAVSRAIVRIAISIYFEIRLIKYLFMRACLILRCSIELHITCL